MWKFFRGVLALCGFVSLSGTVAYNVSEEVRDFVNPAIQNHYCPELRTQDSIKIAQLTGVVDLLQNKNDSLTRDSRETRRRAELVGHQLNVTSDALGGIRETLDNSIIQGWTGDYAHPDSVSAASDRLLDLRNDLAKSSYGIRVGN